MKKIVIIFILLGSISLDINAQETENLIFNYSISYGSVCCIRDSKWDKENILETIKKFEKEHSVIMKGTYEIIKGKEGERTYYFSFLGWSEDIKNKFLNKREDITEIKNRKEKKITLAFLLKTNNKAFIKKIN